MCAPLKEPPTVWCPEVTETLWIFPLAEVTSIPLLGFTWLCPSPGLMCSCARAAAAEALAALCEAAGVLGPVTHWSRPRSAGPRRR